jgi:hypothetical protein
MSPEKEKKQEEKQQKISDAELEKVSGGAMRAKRKVAAIKVLDEELTGIAGGAGGKLVERAMKKK